MNLSEKIVSEALKWEGKEFKPDQACQCAEWVSTVLDAAGVSGSGYKHTAWCPDIVAWGSKVEYMKDLKPGDILLFDYTYEEMTLTHTGIYLGAGMMIHRNTMLAPVQRADITSAYWSERFNQGRRFSEVATEETKEEVKKVLKLFYHDGKASIVINGKEVTIKSINAVIEY